MKAWITRLQSRESDERLAINACTWLKYLPSRHGSSFADINAVLASHRDAVKGGFLNVLLEEMPPELMRFPKAELLRTIGYREVLGRATAECAMSLRDIISRYGDQDPLIAAVAYAYLFREYALMSSFDHISENVGNLHLAVANVLVRGQDFCAFGMRYAAIGLPKDHVGASKPRLAMAADSLRRWYNEASRSNAGILEWQVLAEDLKEVDARWRGIETAPLPIDSTIIVDINDRAGLVAC